MGPYRRFALMQRAREHEVMMAFALCDCDPDAFRDGDRR